MNSLSLLWFKLWFRAREIVNYSVLGWLRKRFWMLQGMQIGPGTQIGRFSVSWPHQVCIGSACRLRETVSFQFDGICKPGPRIVIGDHCFVGAGCEFNISAEIVVGSDCLIGAGTRFIDHNHGIAAGKLIRIQKCDESPIVLGNDVWIGADCVILAGVSIGTGAVVGAGSIVTHSVPPMTIAVGVPARVVGSRNPDK